MPINIFGYSDIDTVTRVPIKDTDGTEFTHAIEPELAGVSIPRAVRWTKGASTWRRVLWNAWLIAAVVIIVLGRRDYGVTEWGLWLAGACVGFSAIIAVCEWQWRGERRLLREGIVVHGLVRSGEVIPNGNITFHYIDYTYWTGGKTQKNRIAVSEDEYRRMIRGNPYFTLLYDATNPDRSIPYFRINAVRLVSIS